MESSYFSYEHVFCEIMVYMSSILQTEDCFSEGFLSFLCEILGFHFSVYLKNKLTHIGLSGSQNTNRSFGVPVCFLSPFSILAPHSVVLCHKLIREDQRQSKKISDLFIRNEAQMT